MNRDRDLRLETPRLRLRPIRLEDRSAFHALCAEPSVRRAASAENVLPYYELERPLS